MGDIGVTVNLQPIADQSALINAAIGGEFQAVSWRNHPGGDPDTAVRVVVQLRRARRTR